MKRVVKNLYIGVLVFLYTICSSLQMSDIKRVFEGSSETLHCSATPKPGKSYSWYFMGTNTELKTEVEKQITVLHNGTLIIHKFSTEFEGFLECYEGSKEGNERVRIVGLQFKSLPTIAKGPGEHFVKKGTNFSFYCISGGDVPYSEWVYLVDDKQVPIDLYSSQVKYSFVVTKNAKLECRLVNTRENVTVSDVGYVIVEDDAKIRPGLCYLYPSTAVCSPFLSPNYIWKFNFPTGSNISARTYQTTELQRSKQMKTFILKVDEYINEAISSGEEEYESNLCRDRLKRMFCAAAFPQCLKRKSQDDTAEPAEVCVGHCEAVKSYFCKTIWSKIVLQLDRSSSTNLESVTRILKNDCAHLPDRFFHPTTKEISYPGNVCAPIDLEPEWTQLEEKTSNISGKCYEGRGQFYSGSVSSPTHNVKCVAWDKVSKLKPKVFPSLETAGNACRNPGGLRRRPFCIPDNPTLLKDTDFLECSFVPHCDVFLAGIGNKNTVEKDRGKNPNGANYIYVFGQSVALDVFITIICCVVSGVIIGLIIFGVVCICRKKKKSKKKHIDFNSATAGSSSNPRTGCISGPNGGPEASPGGTSAEKMEMESELRQKLTQNQLFHKNNMELLHPKLQKLEYMRNKLIDIRDLGCGAFGEVILSEAPDLPGESSGSFSSDNMHGGSTTKVYVDAEEGNAIKPKGSLVAVKVLKPDASEEIQISFIREAETIVEFDHPNIIRLLGICATSKPLCLLLEYMPKGDLNSFLHRYNPQFTTTSLPHGLPGTNQSTNNCGNNNYTTGKHNETSFINGGVGGGHRKEREPLLSPEKKVAGGPVTLDTNILIKMASNVAEAMEYISNNCFVHRDLATRNCMVGNHLQVKISDFSLCRPVKRGIDYIGEDSEFLPIRWLPLESIEENKYNLDTDVWSYGVLLWELFSFAEQPYTGMTCEEVIDFLQRNHVLPIPTSCPVEVYQLMQSCWSRDRSKRPLFSEILKQLNQMRL